MSWRLNSARRLILNRNLTPFTRNAVEVSCKPIQTVDFLPKQYQPMPMIKTNQQISWFSTTNLIRSSSKGNDSDDKKKPLEESSSDDTSSSEDSDYETDSEKLTENEPENLDIKSIEEIPLGIADAPGKFFKYILNSM